MLSKKIIKIVLDKVKKKLYLVINGMNNIKNKKMIMEVSEIVKMNCSETEKLVRLFSGRMDAINVMEKGRGAVTTKVWDDLFQDLIAWKNASLETANFDLKGFCGMVSDGNYIYQTQPNGEVLVVKK